MHSEPKAAPTLLAATRFNPTTKAPRREGFLCLSLSAFFISISISISIGFARILNVPDDFETIQGGIDAAEDGDTVLVQPDRYVENIDFDGHNIVVGSLYLTTGDTGYVESTVIDGNNRNSCVQIGSGEREPTRLSGFTLENGRAELGGGVFIRS